MACTYMQFIDSKGIGLSVSELLEGDKIHFSIEAVDENDPLYCMGLELNRDQILQLKEWLIKQCDEVEK